MKLKRTKQCQNCPWKVDVDPYEIPNGYDVEKHMVVTFFGGSFVLNGSNMKNTKVIWNSELQHASQKWGKVIGNIWQNPDSIIYLNFKS